MDKNKEEKEKGELFALSIFFWPVFLFLKKSVSHPASIKSNNLNLFLEV